MPTSVLTYSTEDPRNGWVVARLDLSFPSKHPGESVAYGFDGSMVTRGLLTADLDDFDPSIPAGATILAVRAILPQATTIYPTQTRVRIGLGDPWTLAALACWQAVAAGDLDQTLSVVDMEALTDVMILTLPLAATGRSKVQAALAGDGKFWIGLQMDEASTGEAINFTHEDPWPSMEIDWTQGGGGGSRICLPPHARGGYRRRRR